MLKTNVLALCLMTVAAGFALAGGPGQGNFNAELTGYNEVPAVVTTGNGQATATMSSDGKSLTVTLNFAKLTAAPESAGLYLGQPATTGGLIVPLCGSGKGQATCPATTSGTVTATITDADILAIPAQGLAAGDLASVIDALTNGAVYVNVATSTFATGEIRGSFGRGFGFGFGMGGGRFH